MQSTEKWLPIPGHLGYEASSLGRVRSIDRVIARSSGSRAFVKGRVLSLCGNARDEYLRTHLGSKAQSTVHRLVCMAFHGAPPFKGAKARHLNDIKRDNRPENLAWGTTSDNSRDSIRNGTWANQHSALTHCKYGHELAGDNLCIRTNGNRTCRECQRRTTAEYQDRNREVVQARWREYAARKRAERKQLAP